MNFDFHAMIPSLFREILPAETYIVGGAVRDLLLGRPPRDWDLATRQDLQGLAPRLARKLNAHQVPLGKPGHPLIRLISADCTLDLTPLEGNGLRQDLQRRDFTINAMAWDPREGQLIDPFGGREDLQSGVLRRVTLRGFRQDPLRLLRAYRFAAQLNFSLDPETEAQIQREAPQITAAAGERVRDELFMLMAVPQSHPHIRAMAESGLLFAIFPELIPTQGCRQGRHHDMDVWGHTLTAYRHLEALLMVPDPLAAVGGSTGEIADAPLLKLVCLLHDMGKPPARTVYGNGTVHFRGHATQGAGMAEDVCRRLRLSVAQSRCVTHLIRRHLDPLHLFQAHQKGHLTSRGIIRLFNRNHPRVLALLLQALADSQGKRETQSAETMGFQQFLIALGTRYETQYLTQRAHTPLLTGKDLIRELNLSPGPRFKAILDQIQEARLSGDLKSRHEALALAIRLAAKATESGSGPR